MVWPLDWNRPPSFGSETGLVGVALPKSHLFKGVCVREEDGLTSLGLPIRAAVWFTGDAIWGTGGRGEARSALELRLALGS